eukprot:1128612-Prymnesium_polylepis.1
MAATVASRVNVECELFLGVGRTLPAERELAPGSAECDLSAHAGPFDSLSALSSSTTSLALVTTCDV